VPPPKVWKAVVKLVCWGRERLFEALLGNEVEFLNRLLVSAGLQQVVALTGQEAIALLFRNFVDSSSASCEPRPCF